MFKTIYSFQHRKTIRNRKNVDKDDKALYNVIYTYVE